MVAAWGAKAEQSRVAAAMEFAGPLSALCTTKTGMPGHPLYLRKDASLTPYTPTCGRAETASR